MKMETQQDSSDSNKDSSDSPPDTNTPSIKDKDEEKGGNTVQVKSEKIDDDVSDEPLNKDAPKVYSSAAEAEVNEGTGTDTEMKDRPIKDRPQDDPMNDTEDDSGEKNDGSDDDEGDAGDENPKTSSSPGPSGELSHKKAEADSSPPSKNNQDEEEVDDVAAQLRDDGEKDDTGIDQPPFDPTGAEVEDVDVPPGAPALSNSNPAHAALVNELGLGGANTSTMGLAAMGQAANMHRFMGDQPAQAQNGLLSGSPSDPSDPTANNQGENAYTDYSHIPCATGGNVTLSVPSSTASGKEPPFPVKLHRILSNAEFVDIVSWLPHGRSWRVLKPKAFEEKVVPLYFRHAKYASFMRQVNGWGFKRITQGPDHNSYYHELFLRGMPHLCLKMRRPARAKTGTAESEINPDFYSISLVAPLPNPENSAARPGETNIPGLHDFGIRPGVNGPGAGFNNFGGLQPPGFNFQHPDMTGMGGLANMNLPNNFGGVGGLGNPALSNALLQQQLQNQMQTPRLGNIGQQLGLGAPAPSNNGGNKSLDLAEANSEMSHQIESLRQRKEQLVRQLQMYNQNGKGGGGGGNAQEPASDPGAQLGDSNNAMNMTNGLGSGNGAPAGAGNGTPDLGANLGSNPVQLQQMMLQLQAAGMKGPNPGLAAQQAALGMGTGGSRFGGLGNMPNAPGLGRMGNNINQQLLLQHGLAPGMGNLPSNLGGLGGNLGLMGMQNQMLPQIGGAGNGGNASLLQNQGNFLGQANGGDMAENSPNSTKSPTGSFGEKKSI